MSDTGHSGRLQSWGTLLGAAALAASGAAHAQVRPPAPSQVTPRDVRPPAPPAPSGAAPAPAAPPASTAPPGSEQLSVTVAEVAVERGFPELAAQTAMLTAPFKGRRSTVAELYDLAAAIEQAYVRAGYVLVRVNPPPQDLKDGGVVRLTVVDGFVEALDLSKVSPKLKRPAERYLKPLVGRRRLTNRQLERQVLLAGEIPGANLTTALARGEQAGGVVLAVNTAYDPFSGQVSLDNRMGEAFGRRALGAQWSLASLAGYGEQVYGFLGTDPDLTRVGAEHAPRRVASLGVAVPVGPHGVIVNPEATVSRTYPRPAPGAPATFGAFDRYVLRATWPILLARGYGLDAGLAFEATDEKQEAYEFGVRLSHDRLRVIRASLEGNGAPFGPVSARGRAELSRGFDRWGARTPQDAEAEGVPLSRPGVTADFTKLTVDGSLAAPAPFNATLQAIFRAQVAIDGVMPSSELFALDAPNALSSFESGATGADAGWTLRLQLGRTFQPRAWGGRAAVSPYVFGAVGEAAYEAPAPFSITRASDYGLGLDLRLEPPRGALRPFATLEVGRANGDGFAPAETRFTVVGGIAF